MKYEKFSDLSDNERLLIGKAFEASEHSVSSSGHKVGSAILCDNNGVFLGATNTRSRAIGSTCAERMAVDQMVFHGSEKPTLVALAGFLQREKWNEGNIITPCGVCLEMYWELIMRLGMEDLEFLCVSWNKERILRAKLTELYPRVEAVKRS